MKNIERKDTVDRQIEKGIRSFKKNNPYPPFLHIKIMARLEEKPRQAPAWLSLLTKVTVAFALLLFIAFAGSKILEKQNSIMYNKIPVAVVLSLESQANLIKLDSGTALDDSIKGAIYNMEQSGS